MAIRGKGEEYVERGVVLALEALARAEDAIVAGNLLPAEQDAARRLHLRERLAQLIQAVEMEHAVDLDEARDEARQPLLTEIRRLRVQRGRLISIVRDLGALLPSEFERDVDAAGAMELDRAEAPR